MKTTVYFLLVLLVAFFVGFIEPAAAATLAATDIPKDGVYVGMFIKNAGSYGFINPIIGLNILAKRQQKNLILGAEVDFASARKVATGDGWSYDVNAWIGLAANNFVISNKIGWGGYSTYRWEKWAWSDTVILSFHVENNNFILEPYAATGYQFKRSPNYGNYTPWSVVVGLGSGIQLERVLLYYNIYFDFVSSRNVASGGVAIKFY